MTPCPHCAGMAKALRAAETRNLEHAKREEALELLVKEMLEHATMPTTMRSRIRASALRLDVVAA